MHFVILNTEIDFCAEIYYRFCLLYIIDDNERRLYYFGHKINTG